MDKNYVKLFEEISRTIDVLSAEVIDFNRQSNDDKGVAAAEGMQENYKNLRNKILANEQLSHADFAKLLIGAMIVSQQLERRIETEKTALEGYKIDIIPKLQRILNECETEEETQNLSEKIFTINT